MGGLVEVWLWLKLKRPLLSPDSLHFSLLGFRLVPSESGWYYLCWPASLMGLAKPRPQPHRDLIIRDCGSYIDTSAARCGLKVKFRSGLCHFSEIFGAGLVCGKTLNLTTRCHNCDTILEIRQSPPIYQPGVETSRRGNKQAVQLRTWTGFWRGSSVNRQFLNQTKGRLRSFLGSYCRGTLNCVERSSLPVTSAKLLPIHLPTSSLPIPSLSLFPQRCLPPFLRSLKCEREECERKDAACACWLSAFSRGPC